MSQKFTDYLTYRVLDHKFSGASLMDHLMEEGEVSVPLKNMCAKVPEEFDLNVRDLAGFLGISKAEFIRRAVESAMVEAEKIMKQHLDQEYLDEAPKFISNRVDAA